jgi:hypothetical protein
VKVVVAAVAASKPTRSAELWSPVVDMKSRGAAGGDLHTSWHKGEHGSRKAIAAAVRPLLKPVEEEDGGGGLVRQPLVKRRSGGPVLCRGARPTATRLRQGQAALVAHITGDVCDSEIGPGPGWH